jgi:hypothetical protein
MDACMCESPAVGCCWLSAETSPSTPGPQLLLLLLSLLLLLLSLLLLLLPPLSLVAPASDAAAVVPRLVLWQHHLLVFVLALVIFQ